MGLLRLLALGLLVVLALAAIDPAGAFSPGVPVLRDAQHVERTIASVRYLTANGDLQVRAFYAAELREQGWESGPDGAYYRDGQALYLDVFPNRFGLTTVILSQRDEPVQPAVVIANNQNVQ
ncbi:MAG TPA: hypothetical protein VFR15_01555 [Chloroflexia bacterium]|nr:hypothetical protein [Chloroflexia bacterium]